MNKIHVRRDDTVIIVSGDDKGKIGKVLEVSPKEGKIIVEGVNLVKKHLKPRPPKENGGIVTKARLATEEIYKIARNELQEAKAKKSETP